MKNKMENITAGIHFPMYELDRTNSLVRSYTWGLDTGGGMPGALHPHGFFPSSSFFRTRTKEALLQAGDGDAPGITCRCATCAEIKSCIKEVRKQWQSGCLYFTPVQNCRDFVSDVLSKCALRKGKSSQLTSGYAFR